MTLARAPMGYTPAHRLPKGDGRDVRRVREDGSCGGRFLSWPRSATFLRAMSSASSSRRTGSSGGRGGIEAGEEDAERSAGHMALSARRRGMLREIDLGSALVAGQFSEVVHTIYMTARNLIKILKKLGCVELRQKGSHKRFVTPCGKCFTTVPAHPGEDIRTGTLNNIEAQLEPCFGKGWLRNV